MKKILIALLMMVVVVACYGQNNVMDYPNEPTPTDTDFLYLIKDGATDANTSKAQFQQNLIDSVGVLRGLMISQQIEIDNNNDSIVVHNLRINNNLTFINTQGDTITAHNLRINTNVDAIAINTTSFQDTIGWTFIDAFYGDSVTDATVYLQARIDAAGGGRVQLPPGNFYVPGGLGLSGSQEINGSGWSQWFQGGTVLRTDGDNPVFYLSSGATYARINGPKITNLRIEGDGNAANTSQHGILCDGPLQAYIDHVFIDNMGANGICISDAYHTDKVYIQNCHIHNCQSDGIYGRGYSGKEINAVTVENTEIYSNLGHGVNLWGIDINLNGNTIQANVGSGVFISAFDLVATTTGCGPYTINNNNYFESNGGGSIYMEMGEVGGYAHVINNVTVSDNQIIDSDVTITDPNATGCITLNRETGSTAVFYFRELSILGNRYTSTNIPSLDGNDVINPQSRIFVDGNTSSPTTEFANLGTASILYRGGQFSGMHSITPSAGVGITSGDLYPYLRINIGSSLDVTANPQIAPGFDGQEITLYGMSDTFTSTWDDGDGLKLSSQKVLGDNDNVTLRYSANSVLWIQTPLFD